MPPPPGSGPSSLPSSAPTRTPRIPAMCGIVGVVGKPERRPAPDLSALRETLAAAEAELGAASRVRDGAPLREALERAAATLRSVDRELNQCDGVGALVADPVAR